MVLKDYSQRLFCNDNRDGLVSGVYFCLPRGSIFDSLVCCSSDSRDSEFTYFYFKSTRGLHLELNWIIIASSSCGLGTLVSCHCTISRVSTMCLGGFAFIWHGICIFSRTVPWGRQGHVSLYTFKSSSLHRENREQSSQLCSQESNRQKLERAVL